MKKALLKGLAISFLAAGTIFMTSACGKKKTTTEKTTTTAKKEYGKLDTTGYNLAWSDEFDVDYDGDVNSDIWQKMAVPSGWANAELQKYVKGKENSYVKDGNLVIHAEQEPITCIYTSAKLVSKREYSSKYGRICVSAKVPEGKGLWPAIWMMPVDETYGAWPKSGEIDIMEILGHETNKTYGTIHYGNPHKQNQGTYTLTEGSFSDDFHEFAVDWEPGKITFYVDGIEFYSTDEWYTGESDYYKNFPAPFNQPFKIQLNLAVGGTWPGNPDIELKEADFLIDYVRVYQKDSYDESAVVGPAKVPGGDKKLEFKEADETGNFITNGDFATGDLTGYIFYDPKATESTAEVVDGEVVIDIKGQSAANNNWDVQLVQTGLPAEKGKKYKLSFDAYADEATSLVYKLNEYAKETYVVYSGEKTASLTTDKQHFEVEFTMTKPSDDNARLDFNLGAQKNTKVYLSNIRLEEVNGEIKPVTGNQVVNGDFASGDITGFEASGTPTVVDNEIVYVIEEQYISEPWVLQLHQAGLEAIKGKTYKISFDAYSTVATSLEYGVGKNSDDYDTYKGATASLTTEKKSFSTTFTMTNDTDNDARIYFNLGACEISTVYITNISFELVEA